MTHHAPAPAPPRPARVVYSGCTRRAGSDHAPPCRPQVSAVDTDVIEVDPETKSMLRSLDMGGLQGIVVQQNTGGWEKKGKRY